MNEFNGIDISFLSLNGNRFIDLTLYDNGKYEDKERRSILMSFLKLIYDCQIFDEQLLQLLNNILFCQSK